MSDYKNLRANCDKMDFLLVVGSNKNISEKILIFKKFFSDVIARKSPNTLVEIT